MNLYLHHTYSSLLSQNKRYISPEQLLPYVFKIPFPFFSFHYSPSLLVLPSQHINMFKSLPSLLNITLTSSHDSLFSFPSMSNFPFHRHGKLVCTSFFYFLFSPESTQFSSITIPVKHPSQDDLLPPNCEIP